MKVGWIGLGTMGAPMAGHVLAGGYELVVWNRTPSKSAALAGKGAAVATDPADLADKCDLICMCVRGSEDVRDLVSQMAEHLQSRHVVVDHTTIDPETTRDLAASVPCPWIDAPVTGGSMGAVNGTLTALCGGDQRHLSQILPILQKYCRRIEHVGPNGHGQLMKAVNQVAVAGSLMGLCESLAFAERAGIDVARARDLLASGAAGSWSFDNYGPKLLAGDWTPGFSVSNQLKDLGYCLELAKALNARLPMTASTAEVLQEMVDQGRGDQATVAVYDHLAGGDS